MIIYANLYTHKKQKEYYNITDHSYHKGYLWLEYDCPMCNCRNDLECEPVIWFGEVKVACEDCNIQLLFKIDDEVIELA